VIKHTAIVFDTGTICFTYEVDGNLSIEGLTAFNLLEINVVNSALNSMILNILNKAKSSIALFIGQLD
jgi:hypothetical protein